MEFITLRLALGAAGQLEVFEHDRARRPAPGYRFLVTLDPADAYLPPAQAALLASSPRGAFQEATGLGAELEVCPTPRAACNDFVHQLPVRHTWARITLKRGVVRDPGLWWWYKAGLTQSLGARRDGAIILLTPARHAGDGLGVPRRHRGEVDRAGVEREQDAVAVETLEIAHEGLTQVPLVAAGGRLMP